MDKELEKNKKETRIEKSREDKLQLLSEENS